MKIKKINRSFTVGDNKNKIKIKHVGDVKLNNDEQLTFLFNDSQYDFVQKNWGFYATPSINGRLKKEGFISALVRNKKKMIYLMVVHKTKLKVFNKYCKTNNQKIIKWLNEV